MKANKLNTENDLKLFRDLINRSNDAIFVADPPTGLFIFVNDKACETLGYERRELLKMGVMDIEASFPDNFLWQTHLNELRQRGFLIFEGMHKRKNGTTFPVEANISHVVLNKREYLVTVVRDITERRQAAREIAERGAMVQQIMDTANVGIILVDKDGVITHANRRMAEMFRCEVEELLGSEYVEHVHPSERQTGRKSMFSLLSSSIPEVDLERRYIRKDGTDFLGHLSSRRFHDARGKELGLIGVIIDITERKRAEEALELTRFTVDNVADAVYWMDSGARIVDVNDTACEMLGYTREELLGLTVMDIDPDFTAGRWASAWEALKVEGKRTSETRHRTKDGRIIPVEIMANYLSFGGRELDCAFARDISRRKRAEENMVKTQKLESLGILAGGIAHDFNNILTAILGNISLARMGIKPGEPRFERLQAAERASYQARELTRQLLTFAKGGIPVKNTFSMEQLIREYVGFAVRGSNVRCDLSFGEELFPVDVDEGQMGQVFNNLVINACQAMPGGGAIRIDASNVNVGPEDGIPLPEGRYVKTSIEDQGAGISGQNLQRIFDPYFTTKREGSGLGLSIVYSVIRSHNGHVTVKSEPGVGTTFVIYLPASTQEAVRKKPGGEDYILGKGRVLLMDDEEIVREVSGEILKAMGYEVEFASGGEEAVEFYKAAMASSRPFDAVIMDLTVPGGMGGKEAVRKLHEADPAVKAIVSSGYSQDPVMANYKEYGFCEVIAKPFSSIELARIMRNVMFGR